MSQAKTTEEFMTRYNPNGEHPVTEINVPDDQDSGESPFIVVRHGDYTVIINPLGLSDHLCVDLHPFVQGRDATAGAFGMTSGQQRVSFPPTGMTSHRWPSSRMVAVIVGEQGTDD